MSTGSGRMHYGVPISVKMLHKCTCPSLLPLLASGSSASARRAMVSALCDLISAFFSDQACSEAQGVPQSFLSARNFRTRGIRSRCFLPAGSGAGLHPQPAGRPACLGDPRQHGGKARPPKAVPAPPATAATAQPDRPLAALATDQAVISSLNRAAPNMLTDPAGLPASTQLQGKQQPVIPASPNQHPRGWEVGASQKGLQLGREPYAHRPAAAPLRGLDVRHLPGSPTAIPLMD